VASQFQTVGWRHAHVQKYGVEFLFGQTLGGFPAVGQGASVETRRPQDLGDEFARRSIIVYDKDLGAQAVISPTQSKLRRPASDKRI
jgi:hypothetical protein